MSLGKVTRKLKRTGKSAVQFRFTSTFEYIDLNCTGTWRPENLRVIWLRSHRRVQSINVQWVPTEDRGPNGAEGRATFDPPLSVALIVTLYREQKAAEFDEKEYKYYIENDGPSGKKILASFNCNMSEYAGIPNTKHTLDMTFKAVSKKINKAVLGITLESEFVKQGHSSDDDMQSTFSSMSTGRESMVFDDEDDEDEGPRNTLKPASSPKLTKVEEEDEPHGVVTLGTGQTLQRDLLPSDPPPKPTRTSSRKNSLEVNGRRKPGEAEGEGKPVEVPKIEPSKVASDGDSTQNDSQEVAQTNGPVSEEKTGEVPKIEPSKVARDRDSTQNDSQEVAQTNGPTSEEKPVEVPKIEPSKVASDGDSTQNDSQEAAQTNGATSEEKTGEVRDLESPDQPAVGWEVAAAAAAVSSPAENGETETQVTPLEASTGMEKSMEGSMTASTALTKRAESFVTDVGKKERLDSTSGSLEKTDAQVSTEQSSEKKEGDGEKKESSASPEPATYDAFDFVFEASKLLASQFTQAQDDSIKPTEESPSASSGTKRVSVDSKETWTPPPNPYLEESVGGEEEQPEPSPTEAWLGDSMLIDCFGGPVSREKLDRVNIIGLYFSANWCPPCRRFLPKLVKFYHHLKQHNKSFEILYISSDYSKQEMMKYMQEQQMPWVGLAFDSAIADKLRGNYGVSAIPLFTIVNKHGLKIEDSAKKPVEGASSSSNVLKLYNKWNDKLAALEGGSEEAEKKGLLKIKDTKKKSPSLERGVAQPQDGAQEGATGSTRQVVDDQVRQRSKSRSRSKIQVTVEMLEEKEDRIHYLEEVNMTLKQTNDDLNEEVTELKKQLKEAQDKLQAIEQSSKQLEDERKELIAHLNIRGWLFKRGVKGPTAHVWRRRYFRCDQGSKIYYYKSASEGTPQGFIDLDKVISVQEVSPAQQDKNHATFLVQCDGRTFQLQAMDETTMRKWMGAIGYLRNWRKKHHDGAEEEVQ